MLTSSSRLRYHYENILRQDLLLKLNYSNIMQVPRLCKINICASPLNSVKSVSLALEIICGQKFVEASKNQTNKTFIRQRSQSTTQRFKERVAPSLNSHRANPKRGGPKGTLSYDSSLWLRSSLRSTPLMYNFLEKLITIISFYDYTIQFQTNTIKITIDTQVRLFPEIQNHFEFFESIQNLEVFLVTSALTEKETQLLWTGLNQKEI